MTKRISIALVAAAVIFLAIARPLRADVQADRSGLWESLKRTADRYVGRPYVWGASGLKSFDCSGFIWRVLFENGILLKRTTARKFYMCLPKLSSPEAERRPGNIVFFDNARHCGIVSDSRSFYHAETSRGTNLSRFDPYWRGKISGYRALPETGN